MGWECLFGDMFWKRLTNWIRMIPYNHGSGGLTSSWALGTQQFRGPWVDVETACWGFRPNTGHYSCKMVVMMLIRPSPLYLTIYIYTHLLNMNAFNTITSTIHFTRNDDHSFTVHYAISVNKISPIQDYQSLTGLVNYLWCNMHHCITHGHFGWIRTHLNFAVITACLLIEPIG